MPNYKGWTEEDYVEEVIDWIINDQKLYNSRYNLKPYDVYNELYPERISGQLTQNMVETACVHVEENY